MTRQNDQRDMPSASDSMILLASPSERYRETYIEAVKEFQLENNPRASSFLELDVSAIESDFPAFLRHIEEIARGENLPDGWVAATEWWVVREEVFVGRVHIRHELNDYLCEFGGHIGYSIRPSMRRKGYGTRALALGLEKAKFLGLHRVLVTADENNVPSLRIIEHNGGVLEDERDQGIGMPKKRRYWFTL